MISLDPDSNIDCDSYPDPSDENYDQSANNMIYQIAAFAWLTFGVLLTVFSIGDYKEYKNG